MMTSYTSIRAAVTDRGYAWFTKPYDLNVFGIRFRANVDAWNDVIGVAYTTDAGVEHMHIYEATTDPGMDWLRDPSRSDGTAILAPGQYRGLWRSGLHKGQRPALVQVAPCRVFRDANRDDVIDVPPSDPVSVGGVLGTYGINLHDGGGASRVGKYSAGCQVLRYADDVAHILSLVKRQEAYGHGGTVSYTLLE